jgi:acetyl esterase/lipase
MTAFRDVVYSRPVGFRPLSLDLYVPEGPVHTTCIYLHGGGWRMGSRSIGPGQSAKWTPSFFEHVAAQGIVVASVDYRLSAEATYPAQLEDVRAAVAFLSTQAEYAVPLDRLVTWGVSAGAQLAAMYALTAVDAGLPPASGVVCWYAVTDLVALPDDVDAAGGEGERGPDARESQLIGAPLSERPDLAAAASPTSFVTAGAPPFLFLHGTADTTVPPRQSDRLAEAVRAVGAEATVEPVDGATHMFPELDEDATLRIVDRSVRFLVGAG